MKECTIFGGILLDKYLEMEQYPQRGQDILIINDFSMAGGCSVNMAATFNNLGGNAHVVSYIGTDATGQDILEYLKRHGFSERNIRQIKGETGYSLVLLENNGERTFITKKGVESCFGRELLARDLQKDSLSSIKNVMVTGYYLLCDNTPELVQCLSEISSQCENFLFDPGPLIGKIDHEAMEKVLSLANIITLNEVEAERINLPKDSSKIIVIKKGKFGGEVLHGSKRFEYKAKNVEAVDTTGAGDSFAAGLMFGLILGMNVRAAVDIAVESAAMTVMLKGPHGFWKR